MENKIDAQIAAVSQLERKTRDALAYQSVFRHVRLTPIAFNRICAFLDFIGDSENSLLRIATEDRRRQTEPYFLAYGILQVLYSRNIALKSTLKAFELDLSIIPNSNILDDARHRVIGHPITSDGGAHVIVRNTLTENGFEFVSYYADRTERQNIVVYEALLKEHLMAMQHGLKMLFSHLAEIENNWRRQMSQNPLTPALQGVGYCMQCISAAFVEEKYTDSFDGNAEILLRSLLKFRSGFAERYGEEDTSYQVDHVIEGVRMLQELFPSGESHAKLRFQIVADGVEENVKKLIQAAADIDERERQEVS